MRKNTAEHLSQETHADSILQFFPVLTDLNEPSHMNSSDSCQKGVFLAETISVYVICLLRLQSECALLASICQEVTAVGWSIPQGGPKVWPVLLT